MVQALAADGRSVHVYVDETRPWLQGARLTAWELAQAGIPYTLLADAAAGWLLASGAVDAVLVGADRIAANGDTANKVGTYPLAVLAARHGVPFHVVAPTATLDGEAADGSADHGRDAGRRRGDVPRREADRPGRARPRSTRRST